MRIFVASWFYPPATSSEGIVTYKLLRNSGYEYDVYSSTSKMWGYNASMQHKEDDRITSYTIETDDIDDWVNGAIQQFEMLYPTAHYECIMTRSTPPESILIGQKIKEKHPEVKWIASLADPVANNPYELRAYIDDCPTLNIGQKQSLKAALRGNDLTLLTEWERRPEEGVRLLCKLKRWENIVVSKADLIISPTNTQLRYLLGDRGWMPKCFALPHSYDDTFYKEDKTSTTDKIVMSYIGYSDHVRSLEPFIRAVRLLRERNVPGVDRFEFRFIGNHPREIQDLVLNYYLDDIIHFEPSVDYYESLQRMQQSDWLLHVDAFFHEIVPGGSLFFAGKLADYMGARKPIFALTGTGSPADEIIKLSGGISCLPWDVPEIATELEKILCMSKPVQVNEEYIRKYSSKNVAALFDQRVEKLCGKNWSLSRRDWPAVIASSCEKLLTICVPGYNVERYLDRCLSTLINCPMASAIEVLVIDDGSKDHTSEIAMAYQQHYAEIVRLIRKENGGHGSTINRALQEAQGRYFMVVDGDDWVDSNQLAKLLHNIDDGKINSDLISSNYYEIDMESGQLTPWKQSTDVSYFVEQGLEELDLENVYFTLASSMIRTDVLRRVGKPLQEHTFYVDVEYILFPIPYLNTVTFVDYYIYRYCRGNAEQSVYIPTMVQRYDHHERVMMRVIQHECDSQMTKAQHKYYDAVLKRLLYTHYSLFMIYNKDKQSGFAQGKAFDEFLCKTSPALAKWIGREMPMVRVARRKGFDYEATKHSLGAKCVRLGSGCKGGLKAVIHRMGSGTFAHKLVYNRFTISIGKMKFFTQGKGKTIKDRLRRYCGFTK